MKKIVPLVIALTACAPVAPLPGVPTGKCSTVGLGAMVGRPATPALLSRAKHRSHASVARILRPGEIVTMEFREGRLNVNVDGRNRVTSFNCG